MLCVVYWLENPLPLHDVVRNRFKLLKKRKGSTTPDNRTDRKKFDASTDSPLLASSSFPANIRFGVKSPLTSPTTSSLSQSTIEATRHMDGE